MYQIQEIRRENLESKLQNVRDDQEPTVVKYYLKHKNSHQLFSPVHNVQYATNTRKPLILYNSLQKVTVEPQMFIDEINEQKWEILSRNCMELLEISRQTLSRQSNHEFYQKTSAHARKRFLSKRQSIELRLGDISSPVSPSPPPIQQTPLKDPFYIKFKKFYNKIGLPNQEPPKLGDEKKTTTPNPQQKRLPLRKHSSLHLTPTSIPTSKQSVKNANYLQDLLKLSSSAFNFQMKMKQDKSEHLNEVTQKVSFIRGEFNKFHELLKEQDSLDNIK